MPINILYCHECKTTRNTRVIERPQTLNVKGREITLTAPIRICNVCGEDVLDTDLDNKTLERFYDGYRKLENLLSPKEIRAIRQKYNLSQVSFAKLLGLDEKTIARYENGTIQNVDHDNMIRLIDRVR